MSKRAGSGPSGPDPSTGSSSPTGPGNQGRGRWLWPLWIAGLIVLALIVVPSVLNRGQTQTYSYTQFVGKVQHGVVKQVTIRPEGGVSGQLNNGTQFRSRIPTAIIQGGELHNKLTSHNVTIKATGGGFDWSAVLAWLIPLGLIIGLFVWIGRRARQGMGGGLGGLGKVGQSKANIYETSHPSTRFSDVAGYEGVKQEVMEVVDYLRNPRRYRSAGAVGPKGILMLGPPGTGKTLVARAVAGEAGVPFLSIDASSFVEMFVGVGASRVRDLFSEARKRAPAIIFVDELDAVGQQRGGGGGMAGSNSEREQTLHQLLSELDGFEPSSGVVVMAATNRPEVLDQALLRPGRFDRHVTVPLPSKDERRAILRVHEHGKTLAGDVDFDLIARMTPGFSGADLAHLINEAALRAVRDHRTEVRQDDLVEARDRALLGRRDESNALLEDEKQIVAAHEGGHALVAVLVEHPDPVAKVSILPAGQALGATEQLPEAERHLRFERYLQDTLAVRLGGRAAELLFFGQGSTGAANDLANATQMATKMVREYGMSSALGPIGFASSAPDYVGDGQLHGRPYADATQRRIDEEVADLLRRAEDRAYELLRRRRSALERLAGTLAEQETIDGDVVRRIARETPPIEEPSPDGQAESAKRPPGNSAAGPSSRDRTT